MCIPVFINLSAVGNLLWRIFSTTKMQEYAQLSLYQSVCGRLGVDLVWRIDIDSRANGSPHAQTSMDPYSQNREKKTTGNLKFFNKHYHHQQHANHLDAQTQAILSITILRAEREASRNSSSQHVFNVDLPRMDSSHSGVLAWRVLRISDQL